MLNRLWVQRVVQRVAARAERELVAEAAATKIQWAMLRCCYDPSYQICRRRLRIKSREFGQM